MIFESHRGEEKIKSESGSPLLYTGVRFDFDHSLSPNHGTFSLVPQGTVVPEDLAVGKRKETVLLWLPIKPSARQNFIARTVLPGCRLQDLDWNSKRICLQLCNRSGVGSDQGPRTCDVVVLSCNG